MIKAIIKRRTEQRELQRVKEDTNTQPLAPLVVTYPKHQPVDELMEEVQNSAALDEEVRKDAHTAALVDIRPDAPPTSPPAASTSSPSENIQRERFIYKNNVIYMHLTERDCDDIYKVCSN